MDFQPDDPIFLTHLHNVIFLISQQARQDEKMTNWVQDGENHGMWTEYLQLTFPNVLF